MLNRMNIIEKFKKGSRIHIKPENRGKFTEYCNGKVTSECIARGKRSSDPAVRKRATFADNARHFKHRSGGLIVLEFKLKRLSMQQGGTIAQLGQNLIFDILLTNIKNKRISNNANITKSNIDILTEEQKKLNKLQRRLEGMNLLQSNIDPDNPNALGGVFQDTFLYLYMNQDIPSIEKSGKDQKAMIDSLVSAEKSANWENAILNGIGLIGNYLSNKGTATTTNYSSSFNSNLWTSGGNQFKTSYSFNTPTLTPPRTNYSFLK